MRGALRLVGMLDWLSAILAILEMRGLANANAQTSPELGIVAMRGTVLIGVVLIGFASGIALFSLASSSDPKKWGATFVVAGLLAPALLLFSVVH